MGSVSIKARFYGYTSYFRYWKAGKIESLKSLQPRKKARKSCIYYIAGSGYRTKIEKLQNIEFQEGERPHISLRDKKSLHRDKKSLHKDTKRTKY